MIKINYRFPTPLMPLLALLFTVFMAGCERVDGIATSKTVAVNEPDNFAAYINSNAGLPSGDYTIVVATAAAGESGDFTLTVAYDDGSEEIFTGSWTASGGQDQTSLANPSFDISISTAGGISITLESGIDSYLYLLNRETGVDGSTDRSGAIFAENDDADATTSEAGISLASSRIDSESFGKAYYDTIDPTDAKTTLEDWKVANGFYMAEAAGRVFQPRFRDTKDLGYGRGMRAWTDTKGNFFAFVENFQVRTSSGNEYTDLNLDALINNTREHHFGSNAIEYSTYPYGIDPITGDPEPCASTASAVTLVNGVDCRITDANPPKYNKFFTFDATQGSQTEEDHANETRLNTVNLDGRGFKAMPGACVYCHGGTIRPLRADGSYRDNCYDSDHDGDGKPCNGIDGDTNAKLQLLEVDSFAFWDETPHTQAEEEPIIKEVNRAIYCTYPGAEETICAQAFCLDPGNPTDCDGMGNGVPVEPSTAGKNGRWSGNFAREMAEGWYEDTSVDVGTDGIADFDRDTFNGDFVPPGWDPANVADQSRAGADDLFLNVVQPICFVCHSRRGTNLGTNQSPGTSKDIDFSTYERFISHAEQIKSYVFDRGVMPLSLRGYNAFWGDADRPRLLALHINAELEKQGAAAEDLVQFNSDNEVDEPGDVIADAGPNRTTPSPVRLFASNTRYADTYAWQVISTPVGGEAASLADAATSRPIFTAPIEGDYVVQLTATNEKGGSDTDTVNIKIDNTLTKPPADIEFADITAVLGDNTGNADNKACADCHQDHTQPAAIPGIPVFWTAASADPDVSRYGEVLARIDFEDPENSLILKKPSGNHHYGNLRAGFETANPSNRQNYDLFLNWIMEGARFSSTSMREP